MLKLTNITKVVNKGTVNEKTIYKNLSLEINSGDFVTIIGSNGAGKSTLLNIISGLTNHDNGNIFLENKSIGSLPEFKRTKKMGRVFQNPELGTIPSMTILENMSMAFNK
ncbi:ATP-binding cassette domain-containing protein, partial [Clostridium perfringens]|uniref:ATP-binding cassette domain-containing protein n=3 Tax=Clostridium TaxID=1485 RepID=UPI002AC47530